ncbi:MAG: LuxR C-terminal-related transcriptional regulator [Micromonosporaceae bacterium]
MTEDSVGYVLGDASAFFAEGVTRILGQTHRMCCLGWASVPQELAPLTLSRSPDVVLAGFEPLRISVALARDLDVPVVLMSWSWRRAELLDALSAGVRGFLFRNVSPTNLEHALVRVARGGTVVPPGWDQGLAGGGDPARLTGPADLTPREAEIVQLVVDGYSNKRVARELGIAHQTAKNHLHKLMTKVGASCREELRDWALGCGVPFSDPRRRARERDGGLVQSGMFEVPGGGGSVRGGGAGLRDQAVSGAAADAERAG